MNKRTPKPRLRIYRYRIIPTNEGQELNYEETFETSAYDRETANTAAIVRENIIIAGLMALFPKGTWDCEVEAL